MVVLEIIPVFSLTCMERDAHDTEKGFRVPRFEQNPLIYEIGTLLFFLYSTT